MLTNYSEQALERRWRKRFQSTNNRLLKTLAVIEIDEQGWSPDDGIQTIKDHLFVICEARRKLIGALSVGQNGAALGARNRPISDFNSQASFIETSARQITNLLVSAEKSLAAIPEGLTNELDDLAFECFEREVVSLAAIQFLLRLIDPSRMMGTIG